MRAEPNKPDADPDEIEWFQLYAERDDTLTRASGAHHAVASGDSPRNRFDWLEPPVRERHER